LRALQPGQEDGFEVELYGVEGPELHFPDDDPLTVTNDLGAYKLCWRMIGCTGPRYHYRVCTSKTLEEPSDLWCPYCMYSVQLWQQHHKRLLPACELAFMDLLRARKIDTNFSCQVVPPFWQAPMDFYNMMQGYYEQVDGRCHWVGMCGLSSAEVLHRDMLQNLAAIQGGGCVVRVHADDICNGDSVAAALEAAQQGYSIVLTPAYTTAWVWWGGLFLPYLQLLKVLAPYCCYDTDAFGNSRVLKM
jgi:hypothetical protein